ALDVADFDDNPTDAPLVGQRLGLMSAVLSVLWLVSCDKPEPGGRPSVSKSKNLSTPSSSVDQGRRATTKRISAPCRAIVVEDTVVAEKQGELKQGDALDGSTWLSLAAGTRVGVRHALSAREYAVSGPARVLPCRAGREEVVLAQGQLRASPGAGARPGAMVLVA